MDTIPRRWTITTWNLRGTSRPPLAKVTDVLRAATADVIVLQEVQRGQAADLAGALAMQHAWALKHHPRTPALWWQAEGLAILTPHRLSNTGSAPLTPDRSTWTWKRRIVQWGLVERDDHTGYRVVNLHLTPHDGAAARAARLAEAGAVAAMFPVDTGAPLVLCGDLNDDQQPGVIHALPGDEHLASPPSAPAEAPRQRLDHVLLPARARQISVDAPSGGPSWAELSDHVPVTVTFELDWVEGDWAR